MFLGRTLQLAAGVHSDTSTILAPHLVWSSSDTTVAIVDSAGKVLGVGVGQSTISSDFDGHVGMFVVRAVLQRADGGVAFVDGSYSYAYAGQCAISSAGAVFCRALPTATDTNPKYAQMPGGTGLQFTSIHTALNLQCGLTTTGMIYCWGTNSHWQFASAAPSHTDGEPVAVRTGALRFSSMTLAGHSAICAVSNTDNMLYCWGHNDENQLGRDPAVQNDSVVAPVTGNLRAQAVSTSNGATCALDMTGAAYCWGFSSKSLGIEASPDARVPTPRPVVGGLSFTSITKGDGHTCALASTGQAYCWGSNTQGQLGIGTKVSAADIGPQQVLGGLRFASVSASYPEATCGITTDGDLYCWGRFAPFTLADRLGMGAAQPNQLAKGIKFRALSRHLDSRVCGVTTDERILCW